MLPLTSIIAILFSVSIVFTYLWVRLNWVSVPSALIVGFMFNSFFFFLFALARDNGLLQSITVGLAEGLIFSVAAVSMGAFFRQTSQKDLAQEKSELDYSLEQMSSIDLKA